MCSAGWMLAFCACSSVNRALATHGADPIADGGLGISWTTMGLLLLLALSAAAIHQLSHLAVRVRARARARQRAQLAAMRQMIRRY